MFGLFCCWVSSIWKRKQTKINCKKLLVIEEKLIFKAYYTHRANIINCLNFTITFMSLPEISCTSCLYSWVSKWKEIFSVFRLYGHKRYIWKTLPNLVHQVISFKNSRTFWWIFCELFTFQSKIYKHKSVISLFFFF